MNSIYTNYYYDIKLPVEDCLINEYFKDSINPIKERVEYCQKNCLRCVNNMEYKRKNE